MFAGKRECPSCKTPQSPEGFADDSDLCSACVKKYDGQIAKIEASRGKDVLSVQLAELRNKEASVPAAAEAFLEEIGGAGIYGRMLAKDFKRVRGEDLTEEQKKTHVVSEATLTKYHSLNLNMLSSRDQMVADSEPISEMNSDDLNSIVANGAFLRIQEDPEFRMMMLCSLLESEPQIFERMIEETPTVEVVG